jgi:hypothetical protein
MIATTMEVASQSTPEAAAQATTPKANPHHWLPAKLAVLLLGIYAVAVAVAPTTGRSVGTYDSPSDSGLIVIDLKGDGTYVEYDQTQVIARGRWWLKNQFYVAKSLVLENAYALPVELDDLHRGKMQLTYPLYHRAGQLCFRMGPDPDYWCKHE